MGTEATITQIASHVVGHSNAVLYALLAWIVFALERILQSLRQFAPPTPDPSAVAAISKIIKKAASHET